MTQTTMPGDNSPKSHHSSDERRPGVELRSDVISSRIARRGVGAVPTSRKPLFMMLGVAALVVVIIAGLAVFVVQSRRRAASSGGDAGAYGDLPLALNQNRGDSHESGLSGKMCDDARRRPIGVMLASDPITRPVSGFADADMVWELPVLVNDVTRFLAVYQCGRPSEIGSVRSARHDYLFLADGVDAVIAHWGGSYHALNRIHAGEFESIDALVNPYQAYFRKQTLPAPYNGFTTYDGLWEALQKLGYRTTTTFAGYAFKDDVLAGDRPAGGTLSVGWPGAYRVQYAYDSENNRYARSWGGTAHVDGETDVPVTPSVVIVMRASNGDAEGPGAYNDVGIEGEGVLEVYQDGEVIQGTWRKNELNKKDPVHFLDATGEPIVFTRGQVWVMAVEPEVAVTWEPVAAVDPVGSAAPSL